MSSLPRWVQVILRVLLGFVGLVASAFVAVVLIAAIALAVSYPNLPEISSLTDYRPKLPMRVFSADGVLLGEFGEERRNFVPIGEIPKVMQDAVLAIEDARFYQHGGVNYVSLIRAGLANFGEGHSAQGASTITMQVARNFYLSTEKTFTRKIYEMLLSLKIESLLTKEQILEVYMNHIALGQRAYGFASASEIYFGKPLKDITIAEAAMLAGLPKAPSANNPIVNPERATRRQRYIIDRMLENGFITAEQRDTALKQVLKYRAPSEVAVHAEYVAEVARQMLFTQYGTEAYTRGLNVYLTVSAADQTLAYHALRKGIMDYERRQVYRGPEDYVDLPGDAKELDARIAEALQDFPDNDELKAAVVTEASAKKVVAVLQSGDTVSITGEGLKPATSALAAKANPKTQIRPGAVVRLIRGAKNEWSITQLPEVEGAFVAMDPRTGAIKAGQPALGAEELRRHLRWSDHAAQRPGEVEEHDLDPHPQVDRAGICAAMDQALRLRCRQASCLPAHGARSRCRDAASDGLRLQRVRQRRLSGQSVADRQDRRHAWPHRQRSTPPDPRRIGSHDRRAQCVRDVKPARRGHAGRHRREGAGHAQTPRHLRQDRHHQRLPRRLVRRLAEESRRRGLDGLRRSEEAGTGRPAAAWRCRCGSTSCRRR